MNITITIKDGIPWQDAMECVNNYIQEHVRFPDRVPLEDGSCIRQRSEGMIYAICTKRSKGSVQFLVTAEEPKGAGGWAPTPNSSRWKERKRGGVSNG